MTVLLRFFERIGLRLKIELSVLFHNSSRTKLYHSEYIYHIVKKFDVENLQQFFNVYTLLNISLLMFQNPINLQSIYQSFACQIFI